MSITNSKGLCPIYKEALLEMIVLLDQETFEEFQVQILEKFCEKYTMPPVYWQRLIKLNEENVNNNRVNYELYSKAHFYIRSHHTRTKKHYHWNNLNEVQQKLSSSFKTDIISFKISMEEAKQMLIFPHGRLEVAYDLFSVYFMKPLEKTIQQNYDKSLTLYKKMEKCSRNSHKWLLCLDEIENSEIIMSNLEYYLSLNNNWKNKTLWNYYIIFLKKHNLKEILDVYSRYCRLFISDIKKREEYRNEIEKYTGLKEETVAEFWIDSIEFELNFGSEESAYLMIERAISSLLSKPYKLARRNKNIVEVYEKYKNHILALDEKRCKKKLSLYSSKEINYVEDFKINSKIKGNFENPITQTFSILRHFVHYLELSRNANILRKLYRTYKYFFAIKKIPLCYRLHISDYAQLKYVEESLFISMHDIDHPVLNNLQVTDILICNSTNPKVLSKIISKISKTNLRNLVIENQDITLNELKALIVPFSNNNCHLKLKYTRIFNYDKVEILEPDVKKMFCCFT